MLISDFRGQVHGSMRDIPSSAWDALLDEYSTPFMQWSWLEALELFGCVGEHVGWLPRHLALYRGDELVAAATAYVRDSSDGDFSRDWGWADALARAGARYYPKFCITVPFTPATGRRILVRRGEDRAACMRELLRLADNSAADAGCSSIQILFPIEDEADQFEDADCVRRVGFQFHWRSRGYRTFNDFLSRFDSKKCNQIKRERAAPAAQGISIRTVLGGELKRDPSAWAGAVYDLPRRKIGRCRIRSNIGEKNRASSREILFRE